MTSNDSSSALPKTTNPEPPTYERLLGEPQRLHNLAWALASQEWEALAGFLQMERQDRLSLLEDSNDPVEREACRIIAKWIKHFLTTARDYVVDSDEAVRHPEPESNPDYMEFDSESLSPAGD